MANNNIDQLTKPKLKAKYLSLVKVNLELEEKNRLLVTVVSQLKAKSSSFEKLVEQLEEHVKCPVCLEVPTSGPIWSCPRGHLVCGGCFKFMTSMCPLCRARMTNTVSLLANIVVKNIEHRCRFDIEGCQVMSEASKVEEHRRLCNFRPVNCPAYSYKSKVPLANVVNHILNKCDNSSAKEKGGIYHKIEGPLISHGYSIGHEALDIGSEAFPVTSMSTFAWSNKFFFLNQVPEALHWNFYVQMLGTEEECERVTVVITLGDQTGNHFVKFSTNPFPIEMSEEDLKSGGMKVRIKTLKKICVPSSSDPGRLNYTLLLNFAEETLES